MYWHAARKNIDNETLVLPYSMLPDGAVEPWVDPENRERAVDCGTFQPNFAWVVEVAKWNDVYLFVHSGLPFIDPERVWVYEVAPEDLQPDRSSIDPPPGSMSCSRARIIQRIWPDE
jgi:hypothetical protein